jgi:hypothetical protein
MYEKFGVIITRKSKTDRQYNGQQIKDKKIKKTLHRKLKIDQDLQLPAQSVPVTTKVVSLNTVHGEVCSIQHYVIKFVSDLRQVDGFLRSPPRMLTINTIFRLVGWFMVFNATFNNISDISWRSDLLVEYAEKTTDLSQVTNKLYHISP